MRLALAVVSLVVLVGSGAVVYRAVSRQPGRITRRPISSRRRRRQVRRGERLARRQKFPRSSRPSLQLSGLRRSSAARAAISLSDDPRFASAKEPLRTHPYSAAMGDSI